MRLADLRTSLQQRRGDRALTSAQLHRVLNQAYLDIASRRDWGWLRRERRYNTFAANSTALVAGGTAGSREPTLTGTVPATSWGKRIQVESHEYRVVNVTPGGGWILDTPLHGALSADAVTLVYDEVALPRGCQKVLSARLLQGLNPLLLDAVEPWQFHDRSRSSSGQPTAYSVLRREPVPPPDLGPAVTDTGAGGGGPAAGTYLYWMTYIDRQSGAESALSPSTSATSTANPMSIAVTSANGRQRLDFYFRIYRSKAGGAVPYCLTEATATSGTLSDTIGDQYLGERAPDSPSTLFLALYPYPDASYELSVLYVDQVRDLDDDNDRPVFDETHNPVLLDGAEALMLEAHDEQGRANQARQRYEAGIARMIARDRSSQETLTVIGRPGRRLRAGISANRWEADL